MEDNTLLEYVKKGGDQIWIGRKPPYDMVAVNLLNSSNFRVSNCHHHNYDIVWFYETLLDDVGKLGWKIVLDELIRLLKEHGNLIIRIHDNMIPSLAMLKMFLGRHTGLETKIAFERQDMESGLWTIVFDIKRMDIEKYSAKDWTFAILTGGKKVDNVEKFLKSIRKYEGRNRSEIIIVGPENERYDVYNVRYIDVTQFRDDQYAEISKKKNVIIDSATNSNLMIVHDRYELGGNFFCGFEKYGYDFDFATVTQFTLDGELYPGYAANNEYMRFFGQIHVTNLNHLYDNQYLNGGLIILKTHTAKKIKFNDMLMWNQMEDVELSHVLMENGIIPRVNFISDAIVLEVAPGYFRSWMSEEKANDLQLYNEPSRRISYKCAGIIVKFIPRRLKYTRLYIKLKNMYMRKVR